MNRAFIVLPPVEILENTFGIDAESAIGEGGYRLVGYGIVSIIGLPVATLSVSTGPVKPT
jgi:hypothetical protein